MMMMINTCMCLKSVPIPRLPSLMAMAMAMAMLAITVSTTTTVLPLPSRTVFTTAVRTPSQLSPLLACLWRKTNPSTLLRTLPCLHSLSMTTMLATAMQTRMFRNPPTRMLDKREGEGEGEYEDVQAHHRHHVCDQVKPLVDCFLNNISTVIYLHAFINRSVVQ